MDENVYQWSFERTAQSRLEERLEQLQGQIANLSRFPNNVKCQSTQNVYCQELADNELTYYNPNCQDHPNSWDYSQEQYCDLNLSYQAEYKYQCPPQNEVTSQLDLSLSMISEREEERRLEELLTNFIERNEVRNANQDASLQNLESRVGQLINSIMNLPQSSLPVVIDHNDGSDEHCTVDTQGKGDESHEAVKGYVELCFDKSKDSELGEETIMRGCKFKTDVETALQVVEIPEGPLVHGERFHFDENGELVDNSSNEKFFVPKDEAKFGGGQSSMSAVNIKEKTNRRHDMVIFAYEPD